MERAYMNYTHLASVGFEHSMFRITFNPSMPGGNKKVTHT